MASTTARAIRMEAALAAIGAELETIEPGAAEEIRAAMESERSPDDKMIAALETIAGILQAAAVPAEQEEEPAAVPAEQEEEPAAVPAEPLTARQRRQRAAAEQETGAE